MRRVIYRIICLALPVILAMSVAGCTAQSAPGQSVNLPGSTNLMTDVSANSAAGKRVDDTFVDSAAGFSIELFKNSVSGNNNSLISPLSVLLALAMTANGAGNETLSQMESVLGQGISIDDLNKYLHTYTGALPNKQKSKLNIANSIWFRDNNLTVEKDFLQTNANYYNAAAYESAFDLQTIKNINNWVKENTGGMIDQILDNIPDDAVIYLINAVAFDAEWQTVYTRDRVNLRPFTSVDGSQTQVEMMTSSEASYLDDGEAVGFIKPYANDGYSFAALLPNEGIDIFDYIKSLTGAGFINTLKSAQETDVIATIPKFSYDYKISMVDALSSMGMADAFSPSSADFSKMGASPSGNLYISEVLHKAFISVDELGTKAGAVTSAGIKAGAAPYEEPKIVVLNRPFVYAIVDNSTKLPVFIGALLNC